MEQNKESSQEVKEKKLRKIIILLSILLVCTTTALAVRYIQLRRSASDQTTVIVPDNLVGEYDDDQEGDTESEEENRTSEEEDTGSGEENHSSTGSDTRIPEGAVVLELYQTHTEVNQHFQAKGLLPGDLVTEDFCIKVYHKHDVPIYFSVTIDSQTRNLADILQIKVTNVSSGQVVCDDTFTNVSSTEYVEQLLINEQEETVSYYTVEVSIPTSAGNEYQNAELYADFHWYVKDEDILKWYPGGVLTGDTFSLILWITLGAGAAVLFICVFRKRRKEAEDEE